MSAYSDTDQITEAVRRLLDVADGIRVERGERGVLARHVAEAFVRRHRPMLERLWTKGALDTVAAGRSDDGGSADATVAEAVRIAAGDGDTRADLRHLATALTNALAIERTTERAHSVTVGPRATPTLDRLGRDLTALARDGRLTPIVGREQELEQLVETLCRRLRRNPLLVGSPGVGKTALVEALAQSAAAGKLPDALLKMRIVELRPATLAAAATTFQELAALVEAVVKEAAQPDIVLFMDELQGFAALGGPDLGVLAQLKPALARGELACIAALTDADYYRTIQPDAALDRRFQPIQVAELSADATRKVARSVGERLVAGRGVTLTEEAIDEAVNLAAAYLRNRYFPDKALDVLDRAVARADLKGQTLDRELVAEVVSDMTGFTVGRSEAMLRIAGLSDFLHARVVGQDDAIDALVDQLTLTMRGLDLRPSRPNGVLLFTGPTGVGKTEVARALAEYLFGSTDRMIRLDMSEFTESHYVARILGSPPGYVGYGDTVAFLDDISSRPFSVILLDEIEKAHPQVHRLFLQVFDDGFMTSAAGRRVYFSDAIVIMTANLNLETHRRPGFGEQEETTNLEGLDRYFPREFVNRIDDICVFQPLEPAHVQTIVRKFVNNVLEQHPELHLTVDDDAVELLARRGYSSEFGAREAARVIEHELMQPVSALIDGGAAGPIVAHVENGRLLIEERTG